MANAFPASAPAQGRPVEEVAEYARIRLADDPHLWATTLFDEVVALGYDGSYPSLTRGLRARWLRPHCEPCQSSAGRDHAIIDHPPGAETQFDWLELPNPPAGWGWGSTAHLFVGALSHSGKWRAVLAESEDQPLLVEALDGVVCRLGGVTKVWRFDRMSTVCHPFGAAHRHVRPDREALRCPGRDLSLPAWSKSDIRTRDVLDRPG